jgi:hypothetical protein
MPVELVVSTLLSVPVGIVTSFVFWWWLARRLAPRVGWSSALVVPPEWALTGTDHDLVRVKIVNAGRRDAIDLQISAQLRIPRKVDAVGSPLFIVELPTSVPWLPRLRRGSYRYIRLCPDRIPAEEQARLRFADGRPALGQDLPTTLARTPGAAIRLYVFAYDSFSGSRKIFVSPDYTADLVVRGAFQPGPSLAPVPSPDPGPPDPAPPADPPPA